MKSLSIKHIFSSSTFKHLRFSFSFFLLPVFMFSLSQATIIDWGNTILAFLIIHLLVFPSSNGYNSYQDKDETSIGGLKHPPKVTKGLFYVTLIFDLLALLLGVLISIEFSAFLLVFILMSRAYSYRKIRLKKYPIIAFLTVFIFQGGFIYLTSALAITGQSVSELLHTGTILCMLVSSLFMGSMYPLTQVYQHESDKKDGVISFSYVLGYNGTFIFSGALFFIATLLMVYYFWFIQKPFGLLLFIAFVIPMAVQMSKWFKKVRGNVSHANFENTMSMNLITSSCMNLYFLILSLINFLT